MNKYEARATLQMYAHNKVPMGAEQAVILYEIAEWEIPYHLRHVKERREADYYRIQAVMAMRRKQPWTTTSNRW